MAISQGLGDAIIAGGLAGSALLIALLGTGAALRILRACGVMDIPEARKLHHVAVPRGGGIAPVAAVLLAWMIAATLAPQPGIIAVILLCLLLAMVSFADDLRPISWPMRMAIQALTVAIALWATGLPPFLAAPLGPWLASGLAFLAWAWAVNVMNFMDGIDGITGIETASLGIGIALLALLPGHDGRGWALYGLPLAAAAVGFLHWNWHRAVIFAGEVGAVPLGFLAGWLLMVLAINGLWAAALILPGYYLIDATWTRIKILARTPHALFRPHRRHAYQRAVDAGLDHAQICRRILAVNVLLAAIALATEWGALAHPAAARLIGLTLGLGLAIGAMYWLPRPRGVA